MSLGFTLEARPNGLSVALPLLAHGAAGLGVGLLAKRLLAMGQGAAAAACALTGGLMLAWSLRRWSRPVQGRLVVDDDGRAQWTGAGAGMAREVVPVRWLPAGGVAWVRLQPLAGSALSDRGAFDLILLRSAVGEDRWRALSTWLAWYERGGPRRPAL